MYSIYNTLSDIEVASGDTLRTDCPNCGGTNTFTVTNDAGTLLWNCYKASCNVKGTGRVSMTADDVMSYLNGKSQKAEHEFDMPEYVIPYDWNVHEWAWEIYGLDSEQLGLLYDVKENRAVFPIKRNGVTIDATGRALGRNKPKWKRYGKSGLPYTHGCGSVAVVVEDCVSAAVVGNGSFVGVALLGTSLLETHKGFLSQFSTAVIALDPDALTKGIQMSKELRGYVNDVRILRLQDDLKYRNPTDMEKLNGIITG
tara:strand:+ start:375 stop:1142 length:768 start_codon:yes stop_codon:yes gene_type:complete